MPEPTVIVWDLKDFHNNLFKHSSAGALLKQRVRLAKCLPFRSVTTQHRNRINSSYS